MAKAEKTAAAPARKVSPIIIARWSEAQFKQARHAITPEPGTVLEDLLNPAYYANIAPRVNVGDVIEARPADGAYYAEIYVWAKGPNWLHVSPVRYMERPPAAAAADTRGFSIEFVEGPTKHRVVRDGDRAELARGFESADEANAWLKANLGQLAA